MPAKIIISRDINGWLGIFFPKPRIQHFFVLFLAIPNVTFLPAMFNVKLPARTIFAQSVLSHDFNTAVFLGCIASFVLFADILATLTLFTERGLRKEVILIVSFCANICIPNVVLYSILSHSETRTETSPQIAVYYACISVFKQISSMLFILGSLCEQDLFQKIRFSHQMVVPIIVAYSTGLLLVLAAVGCTDNTIWLRLNLGLTLVVASLTLFMWVALKWLQHVFTSFAGNWRRLTPELITVSCYLLNFAFFSLAFVFLGLSFKGNFSLVTKNTLITSEAIHIAFTLMLVVIPARAERYSADNLNRSMNDRMTFIRNISNAIRTQLNTVAVGMNYAKLEARNLSLRFGKTRLESMLDTANDVNESCTIANSILDDFLAFDSLAGGKLSVEMTEVHPLKFIINTVRPFQLNAKEKGVTYDMEVQDPGWADSLAIRIDQVKFPQVIRNLISNAFKFTLPGGRVSVRLSKQAKKRSVLDSGSEPGTSKAAVAVLPHDLHSDYLLRVDVTDSGAGISKENQRKLFGQYVQFDAGALQKGGGSGLGLWISKGIVLLHGGSIYVHSDGVAGSGCTFTVEVPLVARSDNFKDLLSQRSQQNSVEDTGEAAPSRKPLQRSTSSIRNMLTRTFVQRQPEKKGSSSRLMAGPWSAHVEYDGVEDDASDFESDVSDQQNSNQPSRIRKANFKARRKQGGGSLSFLPLQPSAQGGLSVQADYSSDSDMSTGNRSERDQLSPLEYTTKVFSVAMRRKAAAGRQADEVGGSAEASSSPPSASRSSSGSGSISNSARSHSGRSRMNSASSRLSASMRSSGFEPLPEDRPYSGPTVPTVRSWDTGLHFLVVDDSPANRKIVKRLLVCHGHDVSEAEDGEQFLRIMVLLQNRAKISPFSHISAIDPQWSPKMSRTSSQNSDFSKPALLTSSDLSVHRAAGGLASPGQANDSMKSVGSVTSTGLAAGILPPVKFPSGRKLGGESEVLIAALNAGGERPVKVLNPEVALSQDAVMSTLAAIEQCVGTQLGSAISTVSDPDDESQPSSTIVGHKQTPGGTNGGYGTVGERAHLSISSEISEDSKQDEIRAAAANSSSGVFYTDDKLSPMGVALRNQIGDRESTLHNRGQGVMKSKQKRVDENGGGKTNYDEDDEDDEDGDDEDEDRFGREGGRDGAALINDDFVVPFDVILMDDSMPNISGSQAVRAIRAAGYMGLIFGVTGNMRPEEVDHFMAQGVTGVMAKPLMIDTLRSTVEAALQAIQVSSSSIH